MTPGKDRRLERRPKVGVYKSECNLVVERRTDGKTLKKKFYYRLGRGDENRETDMIKKAVQSRKVT